jgi:hypothetical protein
MCSGVCVTQDDNPYFGCANPNCSPCPEYDYAYPSCKEGACVMGECMSGYKDCDGNPTNGCESNLSEAENCGACGAKCSPPNVKAATCEDGTCRISCPAGMYDADFDVSNGCELPEAKLCTTLVADGSRCPVDAFGQWCPGADGCFACYNIADPHWAQEPDDGCWVTTDAACGGAALSALRGTPCTSQGAKCIYYSGTTKKAALLCQGSHWSEWECSIAGACD